MHLLPALQEWSDRTALLADILAESKISRRFRADEMTYKIIPAPFHEVATVGEAMTGIRQQHQVEVFLRLHQCLHHKQGVAGVDVVIHQSMGQQQLALQVLNQELIGLVVIVCARRLRVVGTGLWISLQQALPFLSPVVFVVTIVVIARAGNGDLVKIRITQDARG